MRTGELIKIARDEIRKVGGVIERTRKNRHLVVFWSLGDRKFVTTVPCIGGSIRSPDNLRCDIRRKVKQA